MNTENNPLFPAEEQTEQNQYTPDGSEEQAKFPAAEAKPEPAETPAGAPEQSSAETAAGASEQSSAEAPAAGASPSEKETEPHGQAMPRGGKGRLGCKGTKGKRRPLSRSDKIIIGIFNPLTALLIVAAVLFALIYPGYKTIFREEAVYEKVFVAELGKKYERLCSLREPKTVVIGGSSVAFGLDSAMMERYTGREVVNFGLYATLGSKVMLDLSEDGLQSGDIAIFAPELDAQTLSMYFGAKSVWQAIDADRALYDAVRAEDKRALYDAAREFIAEKRVYLEEGAPDPAGVYNAKNFNRQGDVDFDRPYNIMAMGYDPNTTFTLDPSIFSPDFLDYFNDYCRRMQKRGVTVYFSFCPINSAALAEGTDAQTMANFESFLRENLACKVISSLDDYVMEWGYFYDTNLHLNNAGVTVRTAKLTEDLLRAQGGDSTLGITLPDPPGREGDDRPTGGDDTLADCFLYEEETMPDGTVVGVRIVGLTEKGLALTDEEITVPAKNADGLAVIRIGEGALAGLRNLKVLRLEGNIRYLDDGVFSGCETLTDVYLNFGPNNCVISIPDEVENPRGMMRDAKDGITFHAPEEYRAEYQNDYTWGHYYRYFG